MSIELHHLKIGNRRYTYRVTGTGPDVLLIHGWLSSSRMWERAMLHLSPHYRLWALDLAGFGDSQPEAITNPDEVHAYTIADQTQFAAAFCEIMGIRPHAVIGHSMGGTIALQLALEFPQLFERLGLVCPVVTGKMFTATRVLLTALKAGRTTFTMGAHLWPRLQQLAPARAFIAPSWLGADAAQRNYEDFKKSSWGAAYAGATSMLNIRLDRRLHEIDKPTLIITGSRDDTAPPDDARLAAKLIPNARLIEYPQCHHLPHDEETDQFNSALEQFLNESTPSNNRDYAQSNPRAYGLGG